MPAYIYPDESNDHLVTRTGHQIITGRKTFRAADAASTPLTIQGIVSQTGNLVNLKNDAGTTLASVRSDGAIFAPLFAVGLAGSFLGSSTDDRLMVYGNHPTATVFSVRQSANPTSGGSGYLQEWQSVGGFAFTTVDRYGRLTLHGPGTEVARAEATVTRALIIPSDAGEKALVIRAAASQSANLMEWRNSAGTIISLVNSGANFKIGSGVHPPVGSWLSIANGGPSDVAIVAKGFAGQSADHIQVRDSGDGVRFSVDSLGGIRNNLAALSDVAGEVKKFAEFYGTTANATYMRVQMRRRAAGNGWETADIDIQRQTDVTNQQRITFEGGSNSIILMSGSNDSTGRIWAHGTFNLGNVPHAQGSTQTSVALAMQGAKASPTAGTIAFGDSTGWRLEFWRLNGTAPHAYLTDGGSWFAAAYNGISAMETKDEITYLDGAKGMQISEPLSEKFKKLRPVSYKSRAVDKKHPNNRPTLYSFVAEEAAQVMPEIVSTVPKGPDEGKPAGINLNALVTLQTAMIQELLERIEALESK